MHMSEIDVLWLYNLPLHEYTMPVIHCARSPVSIPTALVLSGDFSEQLEQIRAFVLDYFEQSCFNKGIVLYDDNGDAAGLQPLMSAIRDDPVLSKFRQVFLLTGGLHAFVQEFPGLCEAYVARDLDVFYAFPSRVRPNIFLSGSSSAKEFILRDLRIEAVLNAGAHNVRLDAAFSDMGHYLYLDFEDDAGVVLAPYITRAIQFLQAAVEAGKRVLVHCHQGRSRSVSLVVAYLMATEHLGLGEALKAVQLARPTAQPNFSFMRQLGQFEENPTSYLRTLPELSANP
jgi:hypothetical protein